MTKFAKDCVFFTQSYFFAIFSTDFCISPCYTMY